MHPLEDRVLVEQLLRRLDARQLAAITLQFRDGFTLNQIGTLVGNVSPERVRQIVAVAIRRMRAPSGIDKSKTRKAYQLTAPFTEDEKAERKSARRAAHKRAEDRRAEQELRRERERRQAAVEQKEYWKRMNTEGYEPDGTVTWLKGLSCLSDVKFTSPSGVIDRLEFRIEGEPMVLSDRVRPNLYRKMMAIIHPHLSDAERLESRAFLLGPL